MDQITRVKHIEDKEERMAAASASTLTSVRVNSLSKTHSEDRQKDIGCPTQGQQDTGCMGGVGDGQPNLDAADDSGLVADDESQGDSNSIHDVLQNTFDTTENSEAFSDDESREVSNSFCAGSGDMVGDGQAKLNAVDFRLLAEDEPQGANQPASNSSVDAGDHLVPSQDLTHSGDGQATLDAADSRLIAEDEPQRANQPASNSSVDAGDHLVPSQDLTRSADGQATLDAADSRLIAEDEPQGANQPASNSSVDAGDHVLPSQDQARSGDGQARLDAEPIANNEPQGAILPYSNFLLDQPDIEPQDSDTVVQPYLADDLPPAAEGVKYGGPEDLIALAEKLDDLKDSTEVPGQDGVLLDEEQCWIVRSSYRENCEFDIMKLLAKGSFGEVSVIQDRETKVHVAAKIVKLGNFRVNEATNWCLLAHLSPYIVRLLGLIRTDITVMFLSEYQPGFRTLQSLTGEGDLRLIDQMPLMEVLNLMDQLFQALVCMHRMGIAHKDIHGENILINPSADGMSPKVIDFGASVKVEGGEAGRSAEWSDVLCTIVALKFLLIGDTSLGEFIDKSYPQKHILSYSQKRLRTFLCWIVNSQPRAYEVSAYLREIRRELYSTRGPPTDNYQPPSISDGI